MAVSKKHRRRIVVDGATYLWWIAEDENGPFMPSLALTVVSEDGRVHVRYHLELPAELRHVTVLGRVFRSLPDCGGVWRRFQCPAVGAAGAIRPRDVEMFVRWIIEPGESPVEVDYQGRRI